MAKVSFYFIKPEHLRQIHRAAQRKIFCLLYSQIIKHNQKMNSVIMRNNTVI